MLNTTHIHHMLVQVRAMTGIFAADDAVNAMIAQHQRSPALGGPATAAGALVSAGPPPDDDIED